VESRFRDRVPKIVHLEEGAAWVMEGVAQPVAFGFTVCAGNRPEDLKDWMPIEEMRAGGWDPAVRLTELDEDGVDAEVLFPNRPHQAMIANTDPDLHHAMVRAYNDWLSGYCSFAPQRLGGVALLPNRGVPEAVAEFERVRTMPGFVAVQLSCYPHGDTFLSPEDDPLWEAIESSGLPICIHIMLNDQMPFQLNARKLPGTVHFYDAPGRMLELIFGGVFERFPGLRFVLAEVDCGWMPYFAEQADDNYLRHAKATLAKQQLEKLPSEYMREYFSATFVTDTYAIENRHWVGVERMMWSSDYPHITSDWPHSWKTINDRFSAVPADELDLMLAGNAQRIFGFGR
jgi:predicted TIM-barrel fold metal-dependent hydrolase